MRNYERLDKFLDERQKEQEEDTFPPLKEENDSLYLLSKSLLEEFLVSDKRQKLLEIGCGKDRMLRIFSKFPNLEVDAITLSEKDYQELKSKYQVYLMDMNFMTFEDQSYDIVWAQHVLEHSIMPYFTLSEFRRILKPEGFLYVEVPTPDTLGKWEGFPQHYSTLTDVLWEDLFDRCGFTILKKGEMVIHIYDKDKEYVGYNRSAIYFLRKEEKVPKRKMMEWWNSEEEK